MEIQDRNSLLQMLTGVRDAGVQLSSTDASAFTEMLKSAKNEVSSPEKNTKDIEFKPLLKQDSYSNSVKDVERRTSETKGDEGKKGSPKNTPVKNNEAKDTESPKSKKEETSSKEVDEEKVVAVSQSTETTDNVEQSDSDAELSLMEDVVAGDEPLLTMSDAGIVNVIADDFVLAPAVKSDASEGTISAESSQVSDNVALVEDVVSKATETMPKLEMVKSEDVVEISRNVTEDFVSMSKEEALLAEQVRYFDEKITSDKKLKIDVNVAEAKIADSIVKDVLKNRFEIDSLFQSVDVDAQPETLAQEAETVLENVADAFENEVKVLPEAKNTFNNEVNLAQETINNVFSKDASVISVSGKEVVSEVANISKNETFARVTETSIRDNFKGVAKEVVEQIKVNITKSAVKGVDTIDIQLKPEDLGKIQIKMHIAKDGKVQAEIIASRAETADLLQKDASVLSKAFNEAGYDTDSKSFTFSFQNENQPKGQEKDNAELLKFIGDTLEQEAENIAGNDNLGYDPLLGLNIKV